MNLVVSIGTSTGWLRFSKKLEPEELNQLLMAKPENRPEVLAASFGVDFPKFNALVWWTADDRDHSR